MNTNHSLQQGLMRRLCVAAGLLALAAPAALAQTATVRDTNQAPVPAAEPREGRVDAPRALKGAERSFVEKAAKASMSQVQISRVAAARTSNPEVRRLAQRMIDDHEAVIDDLMDLAARRGVSLPAKDPHPEKWEKRNAKNFDRDYIDAMVDEHEDVVKLFDKQARDGEDPDTVAFARKHLPVLQRHLQESLDLKRILK